MPTSALGRNQIFGPGNDHIEFVFAVDFVPQQFKVTEQAVLERPGD
jgi:hypothetical protein